MNSLKTTLVCVILLGVLYGMYQVINTPAPTVLEEEPAIAENLGAPVNPDELDLLQNDPNFSMDEVVGQTEPPRMVPDAGNPAGDHAGHSHSNTGNPAPDSSAALTQIPKLRAPDAGLAPPPSGGLAMPGDLNTRESIPAADAGNALANNAPSADRYQGSADLAMPSSQPPSREVPATEIGMRYPNGLTSDPPTSSDQNASDDLNAPAPSSPASPGSVTDPAATRKLSETWATVDLLIEKYRFQEALVLLSSYYEDQMLTADEQQNLQSWLDALAAKVIYSMDPTLEEPHIVKQGETIEQIAAANQIPPTLLYNINRDRIDRDGFRPGTELKVVKGPFRAEVNLTRQRLTLWLDNMYAGSFPIRVGREPKPESGTFRVANKTDTGRVYTASSGSPVPEMAPNNPYGKYVLDLGRGMVIHGSPEGSNAAVGQGCIGLKAAHARDVYEILDRNSEVKIIR